MNSYRMFIDGEWRDSSVHNPVYDKYSGEQYAEYALTTEEEVNEAVNSAKKSFEEHVLSGVERYEILNRCADIIMTKQKEIAEMITHEVGRTIGDSMWEVERTVMSFKLAAEEARRVAGEIIPTDGMPGMEDKFCYTIRKPLGVVALIMPFNLPLVLTVNKLAPTIAAGNTIVLKPSQVCPGYAVKLVEVLLEAGYPRKHIQLILGPGSTAGEALVKNQDVAFYCYTGSMKGGEHVSNSVGLRRTSMDLGNNSPVIVHKDADVDLAAGELAGTGFYNAGQVCFRPQRLYVHEDIYDTFVEKVVDFAKSVKCGDPMKEGVYVGPLISPQDVERVDSWVKEAVEQGAKLLTGGKKLSDRIYPPTVLTDTRKGMKVVDEEIFGPVLVIMKYSDFDSALDMANDSIYGLHAACYTTDVNLAMKAADRMEAGGIGINVSPATHVPNMPFGGIKKSGSGGNEGPRYTVEEMTDVKTIFLARK